MESDLKPVVLDFYGLPGSGKSTISHQFVLEEKKKGKRVVEPTYVLDHKKRPFSRKIYKFITLLILFIFKHHLYSEIKSLVQKNGYTKKNGMFNQITNIGLKIHFYKKYLNKVDLLVFDEGFAQAAISLSIQEKFSPYDNLQRIIGLLTHRPNICFRYVECNHKTALERIALRHSNDTRIEKLESKEERLLLMKQYLKAVKELNHSVTV